MTKPSRQLPTSDEAVISEKKPRRPLLRPPVQSHYGVGGRILRGQAIRARCRTVSSLLAEWESNAFPMRDVAIGAEFASAFERSGRPHTFARSNPL
jgi:hypothetical protein